VLLTIDLSEDKKSVTIMIYLLKESLKQEMSIQQLITDKPDLFIRKINRRISHLWVMITSRRQIVTDILLR